MAQAKSEVKQTRSAAAKTKAETTEEAPTEETPVKAPQEGSHLKKRKDGRLEERRNGMQIVHG